VHTQSAYDVLQEYQIGKVGLEESIVDNDIVIGDDFHPDDTDVISDYQRNQFLDFKEPLLTQVWHSDFSKSFYLQQVHQPRHLPYSARLFGPWYLEIFTLTPWYVVPLVWLPITANLFYRSVMQQLAYEGSTTLGESCKATLICFLVGNFLWTLIEYGMHRFLFHIDEWLPDHSIALTVHFLLHGIHHNLPMDKMRLVMPPTLFAALQYPFTQLAYFILPNWMANGVIAGAFMFYVLYDTMHYALHHSKLPTYIKAMKVYHMEHHFRNYDAGYGVTSPIWDWVFGTTFDDYNKKQLEQKSTA